MSTYIVQILVIHNTLYKRHNESHGIHGSKLGYSLRTELASMTMNLCTFEATKIFYDEHQAKHWVKIFILPAHRICTVQHCLCHGILLTVDNVYRNHSVQRLFQRGIKKLQMEEKYVESAQTAWHIT